MAERGQHRARIVASEGASCKPWQLPCGVEPASAQKSKIGVWEPLPRFQKMYGNAWMPWQKSAVGEGPSWRISARAVQKGNVGSEPQHRIPTGAPPSGAVRRGPPSSRPQNDRSTDSLLHAPGKTADNTSP
nr:B lymphocyte activation-related protein BC-1514 [Homo sapiens]